VQKASDTVALPAPAPAWCFGNADAGGFYRVRHDPATEAALRDALPELGAVERLALVGDQWALVRADRGTVETFLDLAAALAHEPDHDVIDGVAAALGTLDHQVVHPSSPPHAPLRPP